MSGSITVMQYASKFTELSRFQEGLTFYICNQLAGQPILTYKELHEWAAKMERVKTGLKALNLIN